MLAENEIMLSKMRAKLTETEEELHAERLRSRSSHHHTPLAAPPVHVSPPPGMPLPSTAATPQPMPPHYSLPPFDWNLRRDLEELERKVIRLEAEQRVERQPERLTYREGELELMRLDLRDMRRKFHMW